MTVSQYVLKFATERKLRLSALDYVSKHNSDPIKFYFLGGIDQCQVK